MPGVPRPPQSRDLGDTARGGALGQRARRLSGWSVHRRQRGRGTRGVWPLDGRSPPPGGRVPGRVRPVDPGAAGQSLRLGAVPACLRAALHKRSDPAGQRVSAFAVRPHRGDGAGVGDPGPGRCAGVWAHPARSLPGRADCRLAAPGIGVSPPRPALRDRGRTRPGAGGGWTGGTGRSPIEQVGRARVSLACRGQSRRHPRGHSWRSPRQARPDPMAHAGFTCAEPPARVGPALPRARLGRPDRSRVPPPPPHLPRRPLRALRQAHDRRIHGGPPRRPRLGRA